MEEIVKSALLTALTGESNAVQKYKKFEKIAKKEGFKNVAYLFKALIYAENIHIKNHQNALGEKPNIDLEDPSVNKTLENVQNAYNGEMYEYREMYPQLRKSIKKAKKNQFGKVADLSLTWSGAVELTHAQVLKKVLDDLNKGQDFQIEEIYVCRVCGNLRLVKSDDICPICGHDAKFFQLIRRDSEA